VLIDGIPSFGNVQRDVIRRFINLIDTLYDSRVCLIASAAAEPDALYPADDMQFLFERTSSRLFEMRSDGYLTGRIDRLAAATSA
jgi:cell division protein ZapE